MIDSVCFVVLRGACCPHLKYTASDLSKQGPSGQL